MTARAVPSDQDLRRRRSLPPGGHIAMHMLADGWQVRTALWPGESDGPGSILFLTGRGDFLEKYCETFHDLVDAGWGVASFDWRGQGLSGRLGDTPMKGDCRGFGEWRGDLDEMLDWFETELPGPRYVIAHSMAAQILMFALVDRAERPLPRAQPDIVRYVLLTPMIGLLAEPLGPWLAARVARWMVYHRRGGNYVWNGGDYAPGEAGSKRQRNLTSDTGRYADEAWWVGQNPKLALGSATWNWLYEAMSAPVYWRTWPRGVMPGHLALPLQMLVLMAEHDRLVDNAETIACFAPMPDVIIETITGAGHELLREVPQIRSAVLARVTEYLKSGA
jgi:lysophospholipase